MKIHIFCRVQVYGIPSVINTANYVMFIALERTIALGHPEAVRVYSEQMLELHRGQGKEIYWRDNYHCPTEEEYKTMTIGKTGTMSGVTCVHQAPCLGPPIALLDSRCPWSPSCSSPPPLLLTRATNVSPHTLGSYALPGGAPEKQG